MPWMAVPTRTQQLLTRLRDVQILFFEPSGPGYQRPGRRVRPGLTVYTLPPIPDVEERHPRLFRLGQRRLVKYIRALLERHRFREPVLWCDTPQAVHLLDELPCRGIVYDCCRDWSELPIRWESDLALAADVIFAASPELIDHLSPCNDNIALLPNGVSYPMFTRPGLECPPELCGWTGPMLGYVGTIHRDLELSPALSCALALPEAQLVFVGQAERGARLSALEELPNVTFLGPRLPVEIPDYLGRFDVCLNLLRQDAGYQVIPRRMYEYLSSGKPIVSMLYPDQVEHFPDVVYSAHTPEEFARLCRRALAERGNWVRARRREYGAAAAWSERAGDVMQILSSIGLY